MSYSTNKSPPVAFFDFDGTLTTCDSLMPFLKYVVGAPVYYSKLAIISPVLAAYAANVLRNDIAKQIVLKQYLANYHIDELFDLGQSFSKDALPRMLRSEGMERLRWHQAQGHECVLVSASIDFYLNAWAKNEKFSSVICTTLEEKENGYVSGKINGQNCHGLEKQRRITEWLANRSTIDTYAYGDTTSDIPMLSLVKHGNIWSRKGKTFIPVQNR